VRRRTVVFAVVGTVALLGVAAWLLLRTPSEQPFWDYVAELKAAGEPTTFEEFLGPMPAEAENAAPEIEAALAELERSLGRENAWPNGVVTQNGLFESRRPQLTEEDARALADFADSLGPLAQRVAAALQRPHCRFARASHPDGTPDFSGLKRAEAVVALLRARASFARDPMECVEACRSLALMANLMESSAYDERVVAGGALRCCVVALREGLVERGWDAASARKRLDAPLSAAWLPRTSTAMRSAGAWLLGKYAALLEGRAPSDRERLGAATSAWVRLKRLGDHVVGNRVERVFESGHAKETVEECRLAKDASDLPVAPYPSWRERYHDLVRRHGLFNRVEPHWECDIADQFACAEAAARLARVALALAERRQAGLSFPASLDELLPLFADGVPQDPYSDGHFLYERTSGGVRVWSRTFLSPKAPATFDEAAGFALAWELKR
jgi:hypothetical protein